MFDRGYRRFSNVSDVVSRKLSTTIGWRTVSIQEVVTQVSQVLGSEIVCNSVCPNVTTSVY